MMGVFSCILEFIKYEICGSFAEWVSSLIFVEKQEFQEEYAPFLVSEYLDRMEKEALEILEGRKPADRIIILWWGLDGLRLNEDGTLEWISRRKPEPVSQDVFYQPCQTGTLRQSWFDEAQSTRAQIQAQIQAQTQALIMQNACMRLQAAPSMQNAYMTMQTSQMPGYMPMYSALTQCCCNDRPGWGFEK